MQNIERIFQKYVSIHSVMEFYFTIIGFSRNLDPYPSCSDRLIFSSGYFRCAIFSRKEYSVNAVQLNARHGNRVIIVTRGGYSLYRYSVLITESKRHRGVSAASSNVQSTNSLRATRRKLKTYYVRPESRGCTSDHYCSASTGPNVYSASTAAISIMII